ncbi:MAG: DUF5686 family protein [Bacteroidia bacterium]
MSFPHRLWLLVMLLCPGLGLQAQVSGWVIDAESGDSLPFAHVLHRASGHGVFSGLDGRFDLVPCQPGDSIRISLLGYVRQDIVAERNMLIQLQPGGLALRDVVIVPTENPALRIVRNAVDHRQVNDPQQLHNYSFHCYNKLTATPLQLKPGRDTSLLRNVHIFLSETVTRRRQIRPGKVQEEIISARLAGYPGRVIPFTAADLQDLSFYENFVGVFGQQFLNPMSPPGLNQYQFELAGAIANGQDSIFTIRFQPRREGIDGLAGEMRIQNGDWALLTVEADLKLGEQGLLIREGFIRQIYTQLPSGQWVPSQLNTRIDTKPISGNDPMRFRFEGISILTEHQVGTEDLHFRSEDQLIIADGAGREDTALKAGRAQPLSQKDSLTYFRLDSLGKELGLARVLDQTWKLTDGRLMLGKLDVLLDKVVQTNRVERFRLGLGLATNENLSRRFSLGGYAGWGIHDKELKFGVFGNVTPLGDDRLYLGGSYRQDLVESGYRRWGLRPERGLHQEIYREFGIRNWYIKDMEYVTTREFWVGGRLPGDLGLRLANRVEEVAMAYPSSFDGDSTFTFDEWELGIRWAPGAKYARNAGRRVLLENKAPVLMARYARGLDSRFGDYEYNGLAFALHHDFRAFRGGKGSITLLAGWNDRSLPRSRMRVFRATYDRRNQTQLAGAFNTMRYDEFAADMYAEGFIYLDPKLRWFRLGKIQPQLHFSLAGAWGQLHPTSQGLALPYPVRAPRLGYWEPGISITHLLPTSKRDDIIWSFLRTLGVGLSYRAGAYTLPNWKDNVALRLTFGGSR